MSAKIYINRHNKPTITPPLKHCVSTRYTNTGINICLEAHFYLKKKSSKLLRLFIKTLIS